MMRLLVCLVVLTLGVADAGRLFYELQQAKVDDTVCPDKVSKCPATATCCQLENKQWGCCPFVQATCCSDNVHCCPNGYSCNAGRGECVQTISNNTTPWAKKQPAPINSEETNPENSLTCPDRSTCPGTASCCRHYTGLYTCCSYPNDVCCSDGLSCCPRCTICDLVNRRCISGFERTDWAPMTPSEPSVTKATVKIPASEVTDSNSQSKELSNPLNVVWCDSTHYCPNGSTCCPLPTGQWGCCPMSYATCCTGSAYCCPYGKRCTNPPGGCV